MGFGFNCLGGVATAGGHGHICLYSAWACERRVVGGVIWEAARRVAKSGYGICDNSSADFEVEGMKLVLERMAGEAKCGVLYHTFFSDTVVEDGRVVGAIVQNKTGRGVIRARRFVDDPDTSDTGEGSPPIIDMGAYEFQP